MLNLRLFASTTLAAVVLSLSSAWCYAQNGGNFSAGINFPAGLTPSQVSAGLGYLPGFLPLQIQTGDFNGDGNPDIVAAGECTTTFSPLCVNGYVLAVYLGNGNGTFQAPVVSGGNLPPGIRSIIAGDFNGDGKLDVAVAADCLSSQNCGAGTVTILLGNGDGTFTQSSQYPINGVVSQSNTLAIGDFNHDGKLDLAVGMACYNIAVSSCTYGSITIFPGNGDGTLANPTSYTTVGNSALYPVVGDFNGDGNLDIIAGSVYAPGDTTHSSLTVLLGKGDGSFTESIITLPSLGSIGGLVAADFSGDGKLDLAINTYSAGIEILSGNGDGTFQAPISYLTNPSSASYPGNLYLADFNGDGKPDLVAAEANLQSATSATLLINDGNGAFAMSQPYWLAGNDSPSVVAGDFIGDGKMDVVLSSFIAETVGGEPADGTIGVLLGNGDGTMQGASQVNLTPAPQNAVLADLNGDGIPDIIGTEACYQGNCQNDQGGIIVALGLGNGQYGTVTEYPAGTSLNYTNSIAVGDINGDGKLDVIAGGSTGVAVLLGAGDGSLGTANDYPSSQPIMGAPGLGDFAGNGKLGVAVVHQSVSSGGAGDVGIFLGNGDGTLQPETITDTPDILGFWLTVGDFNHDGKADVAALGVTAVDGSVDAVTVLLSNGDGTLTVKPNQNAIPDQICQGGSTGVCLASYPAGGTTPAGIATADMNGDGNLDLVIANGCSINDTYCSTGSVAELLGVGNGAFADSLGASPVPDANFLGVSIADVNGDGKPDIIATTQTGVAVWLGTGLPFLTGPATVYASIPLSTPTTPAIADLNGDGSPDIAISDGGTIAILYNRAGGIVAPPAVTAATISSSANPSVYGLPITITAAVTTQNSVLPTGVVTFTDGGNALGTAPLVGGLASLSAVVLTAGTHNILAIYDGGSKFVGSSSQALSQVVEQATSATLLASAPNPSYLNQPIIFTATVTSQYGGSTSGTVTFKQGTTALAGVSVVNGNASYTTTYVTAGTRSITASYSGDGNNLGGTSAPLKQVVKALPAVTTTSVSTSGTPSMINQSVTFLATVTSTYGPIPDGEAVSFFDEANPIGTGATSGGVAAFSTSALAAKTHTIRATYAGDATFKSSSGTVQQIVNLYRSTTILTTSLNPSAYGQSVSLSVTVISSAPGGPTGTVAFKSGTTTLGTATLNAGTAVLTSSKLPAGTLTITATYKGDAQSAASSVTATQTVSQATTSTTLISARNPSNLGQTVKFTATVNSATITPTGSVTFNDGANVLATVDLAAGKASYSTSSLGAGSHNISATYNGTANIGGSASEVLVEVIK